MDANNGMLEVPDGGWGWVVVAAVAWINMTNQSILSVFGLLFGSELESMEETTFTSALIINLNSLALNFSGLFVGPTIKSFKARYVAVTGCLLVSFGLALCTLATKGWHFIIGYSFFVGLGLGLISPSTFVAINSYFNLKRGRAVGVSLAGSGLGQIIIPHLVRFFLDSYGFRAAIRAMSILSFTGILGAIFLKPLNKQNYQKKIQLLVDAPKEKSCDAQEVRKLNQGDVTVFDHQTHSKLCRKLWQRIAKAMDLELLHDFVFLSIIIGMALVYTSTINFTMVFPNFLMYYIGLNRTHTASCLSIIAGADIVFRLVLPCFTDKLRIPYRVVFLFGTTGLFLARSIMAESSDIYVIILMSILMGISKSATVINNNLTISAHCCPEKLAGGLGLNMLSKGALVITVGQLLGWIRDYTDSYKFCLYGQNVLLITVIVVWTPEIYMSRQKRKQSINERKNMSADPDELTKINV